METTFATSKRIATVSALRRCELFATWPTPFLEEVASLSRIRDLAAGEFLYHGGTSGWGLFIVRGGAIKLHVGNAWGKERVIHVFRPWESLGEEGLVTETGYLGSACATEASSVLVLPKAGFMNLLQRQPELSLTLVRALGHRFDEWAALLEDLRFKDVPTRVAHWLLQHCPHPESRDPQTILLDETKRLLASELGTSSETLSRILTRFRRQRLLAVDGRRLTLLCPARLARLMNQCPAPALVSTARRCSRN